jgi:hypothetical protein
MDAGSRRINAVYAEVYSSAAAMRFAMSENGRRPQAVIMVPGIIELDMTRSAETVEQQTQCRAA